MPAGIIRGAFSRVGYAAIIIPEITFMPQCEVTSAYYSHFLLFSAFQVKLPKGT